MFRPTKDNMVLLAIVSVFVLAGTSCVLCKKNSQGESFYLMDGVKLDFRNGSDAVLNLNFVGMQRSFEGRGGGGGGGGGNKGGGDKKLLKRILPLFIMPFLIQSAIVPMFLSMLKMMLMKSLMVGKLALILIAINALKNSNAFKSRSEENVANIHYGYHGVGMEEYGAYVNGRSINY